MLNYEHIQTIDQLKEFVDHLNELSLYEKHLLFSHIFEARVIDLRLEGFNNTPRHHVQKWWFSVNKFQVYSTIKINHELIGNNPERAGSYEQIYFHLEPNDYSGISQIIT